MGIAWHYGAGSWHHCPCLALREESPVNPKRGAPFCLTLGQIGTGAWALGRALARGAGRGLALGRGVLVSGRHGRVDGLLQTCTEGLAQTATRPDTVSGRGQRVRVLCLSMLIGADAWLGCAGPSVRLTISENFNPLLQQVFA